MSKVSRSIHASPSDVFSVLANGWFYTGWVVGTSHMQAVEEAWPAAGSRLFHSSGVWPAVVQDETVVEEVVPEQKLVLRARGRPFGTAHIELTLVTEGAGTLVTMDEIPSEGPASLLHNRLADLILDQRNKESLARLAAMAERRTTPAR